MKRSFTLSLCAALLASLSVASVRADDIDITLEWNPSGTWELFAEVTGSGGVDGSNGISAVRALIDGIDFGIAGDAVTIAGGIGAINPVNGGPPVLDLGGGVIEVLYGQDISDGPSVVTGVGVGGPALIALGTFSGGGPSFGMDGNLSSQGLFLDSAGPNFGAAIDPDNNILIELHGDPVPHPADLNQDGFVDGLDLGILLGNFNQSGIPQSGGELNGTDPVDGLDLGILLGEWSPPGLSAASAVPEPSTATLLLTCCVLPAVARRRRYRRLRCHSATVS